jgi:hypothetical protein
MMLAACASASPASSPPAGRAAKESPTMPTIDELQHDLAPRVLAGLAGPELDRGRALLGRLVTDWLAEAQAGGALASQVLALLRGDLERDAKPLAPRDRVVLLDAEILDRELRALGNASFALGKQLVDGTVDDDARGRGLALLDQLEALAPRVAAVSLEPRRVALRRQLEDATLEALYAVERKAMSPRLSRYAQDQRAR